MHLFVNRKKYMSILCITPLVSTKLHRYRCGLGSTAQELQFKHFIAK